MIQDFDFLGIASWLGILAVAIEYYVSNFLKPEKWQQFDKEPDSMKREKLRKGFKTKWNLTILPLFAIAVLLGLFGIVAELVN